MMATPEEPEQDVSSHSTIEGGEDEVDFSWPWQTKSLLELVRNTGLLPEDLRDSLLKKDKDANTVDANDVENDRDQGYGPIHYIVTGRRRFKRELLLVLFVYGNADLDLTTTQRGMTALQLAVEQGDLECVKILVALGADVNIPDHYGKTALNIARLKSERKLPDADISVRMETIKSEEAMLVDSREMNLTETVEVVQPPNLERIDVQKYSKIAGALESVGALPGKMVSPHPKRAEIGKKGSLEEELTASCQHYKRMEENTTKKLQDKSYHPTPKQALELVTHLQREVDYRRRFGSRILCLDGGGVRGLVQIEILRQIEKRTGKKITELFDWIVGTSTGGIIALAMVYGNKSVHELQRIYIKEKRDVFGKDKRGGLLGLVAKGNTRKLQEVLQDWLGKDVALNERNHPKVLIPAVYKQSTHLELHFFNNCFDDEHSQELVWKVARYTSAAPFYFSEQDNYIDGGVLANNPSEDCLTAIQQHYRKRGLKLPISLFVSIGSGQNPSKPLRPVDLHKMMGFGPWFDFMELLGSAVLNVNAHQNCASRCQEQGIEYFRFNPPLENAVESNEKDNKKLLDMLWETRVDMNSHSEEMDRLVKLLDESELGSPQDY